MPVMEKLRYFVAQEPIVAASCLIAGVGQYLPFFLPIIIAPAREFWMIRCRVTGDWGLTVVIFLEFYFVYINGIVCSFYTHDWKP